MAKKKDKKKDKPRLGRIPVPPPGYFLEKDEYDRKSERKKAQKEIDEAQDDADEK
jgi:hypothetical protein